MKADKGELQRVCEGLSGELGSLPRCRCDGHLGDWLRHHVGRLLDDNGRLAHELGVAGDRVRELESDLAEATYDRDEAIDEAKYLARKRDEAIAIAAEASASHGEAIARIRELEGLVERGWRELDGRRERDGEIVQLRVIDCAGAAHDFHRPASVATIRSSGRDGA
jgi:hypothetical protein